MRQLVLLAAVMATLGGGTMAGAATYEWQPVAAGTYSWNNDTHTVSASDDDDNWNAGPDASTVFPNAAQDVANVNNDIVGNVGINLQQDVTIGVLNLGDANGSNAFALNSGVAGSRLTFDNGSSAAQVNLRNEGTVTHTIGAPIALNSNLNIDLAASIVATNSARLTLSGNMTLNNRTVTVTGGYVGGANEANQITLAGGDTLIGNGTIVNNSNSPLVITGDKSLFTGTLIANGQGVGGSNTGTFTLTQASVRNAAEIVINGNHNGSSQLGGSVHIGTGSTLAPAINQRLTQNRVTMNGGLLNIGGIPLAPGNTTTVQTENVANLDFNSGYAFVNMTASNTTGGNLLNVATLERGEGATVFFRQSAPQTNASGAVYARFAAGNADSFVVGSTATSGNATRVIPWMISSTNVSNLGIGGLATYDAVEGFRPLRTGEFAESLTSGANVKVGGTDNLSQDYTLNSLQHTGNAVSNMMPNASTPRTITINSGALAFNSNNSGIGAAGNNNGRAGTLDFAGVEAVVINTSANTNSIGAAITNASGLTKGGTGTLVLTGDNDYSGNTNVSGGTLRVGDGTYASNLGDGDVTVHAGALLDLLSDEAINDAATLSLLSQGLFNGKVNIGENLVETIGSLILAGDIYGEGYYGSSAAASANPSLMVNVNDTYFTGTGVLEVAAVPEPGSLALLGMAALATLRRQRRA
ncbi:MAG TPA: autotransporter-associated beta strand repeat-containing protein [Tepidisphaeraceae bacterium]|nr:autotransporter-associated beta strand repeat-containing protein [Tepidisphaeraceae bacterium]